MKHKFKLIFFGVLINIMQFQGNSQPKHLKEIYLPTKYVKELGNRNRSYKINKNLIPIRAIVFQKNDRIIFNFFPGAANIFKYEVISTKLRVIRIKTSLGMKLDSRLECWTGLELNLDEHTKYLESKYYKIEKTETALKRVIRSKMKSDTIPYTSRWFDNTPSEYPLYDPISCE